MKRKIRSAIDDYLFEVFDEIASQLAEAHERNDLRTIQALGSVANRARVAGAESEDSDQIANTLRTALECYELPFCLSQFDFSFDFTGVNRSA